MEKISNTNIKKNYLLNVAYQLLAICIPLITTPYVSRVLQAEGIGAYSYTVSIVTYFSMFGTLGLSTHGQLEVAKVQNDIYKRSVVLYEIFVTKIAMLLIATVAYYVCFPILGTYSSLYTLLGINLLSTVFDISWFFQGIEQFKVTVTRNFFIKIFCTVLILIFVKDKQDLILYALILQGSTLASNISLIPALKQYVIKVKLSDFHFSKHIKASLIYFIPTIATSVYTTLDKSMIGWITNSAYENGVYEQAHKIEQILVTVVTSIGTVTLPRITFLFKHNEADGIKKIMDNTIQFVLLLSIPMCIGLCAISSRLIPLFLGDGYNACINLVRIFSLLIIIVGLDNTIGKQCLVAMGRQQLFNRGVIFGATINLICNTILIPILKSQGAAIGSVLAEGVILILFCKYSKDYIDIKKTVVCALKYLLASLIMSAVVIILGNFLIASWISLIIQMAVGVLCYVFALLIMHDKTLFMIIRLLTKRIMRH